MIPSGERRKIGRVGENEAVAGQAVGTILARHLAARGGVPDSGQRAAAARLDRLARELEAFRAARQSTLRRLLSPPAVPRGVYLWGGVGRGKSLLMDAFFAAVAIRRKRRVHFHAFMRDVHEGLATLKHEPDPLATVADRIAKRYRLICFDEFHVADVTDAMILHRLLASLFDNGVGFVTTSNFKPDELYPDGLHRDRILPAIALLNERMEVVNVDNGTDYRRRTLENARLYHCPLGPEADAAMRETFDLLAEVHDEDPVLHIEAREIRALRRAGGVVWFDFRDLCMGPRSQNDYLEIATQFHTVLLSGVPYMPVNLASPARRFTWLVDVLYDRRVKLIVSAAVPPEELYTEGPLAHEFPRTVSRLNEMQSKEYLQLERRMVDTGLT